MFFVNETFDILVNNKAIHINIIIVEQGSI